MLGQELQVTGCLTNELLGSIIIFVPAHAALTWYHGAACTTRFLYCNRIDVTGYNKMASGRDYHGHVVPITPHRLLAKD
jgi:hypothetical protein